MSLWVINKFIRSDYHRAKREYCAICVILHHHKTIINNFVAVLEARNAANIESGSPESELPSYTIASGLPSYEEALEQLKKVKQNQVDTANWVPQTPPTPLSVKNLFQMYRGSSIEGGSESSKPTWNKNTSIWC